MAVKYLSILETVQEVTDFVLVQASHPQFRSLSFLRNLQVINGRKLGRLMVFAFIDCLESLTLYFDCAVLLLIICVSY